MWINLCGSCWMNSLELWLTEKSDLNTIIISGNTSLVYSPSFFYFMILDLLYLRQDQKYIIPAGCWLKLILGKSELVWFVHVFSPLDPCRVKEVMDVRDRDCKLTFGLKPLSILSTLYYPYEVIFTAFSPAK